MQQHNIVLLLIDFYSFKYVSLTSNSLSTEGLEKAALNTAVAAATATATATATARAQVKKLCKKIFFEVMINNNTFYFYPI